MTRLKHVAALRAGGTPTVDDPRMWADDGTPWVSIGDMSTGHVVTTTHRQVSDVGISSKRLPVGTPGTILFAMYASVGAVAVLGLPATWNQALLGITPFPGQADDRFVRYWLDHLRRDLAALTRSNTQDNLNAEQVGNFPFPTVPLSQQRAIADFLDTETARIDALITKKRRLIELLDERVISDAGRYLRSVQSVPLRRVAGLLPGFSFPGDWFSPTAEGPRLLRGVNVGVGEIRWEDTVRLATSGIDLRRYELQRGDIVVGMDRPFIKGGSRVAEIDAASVGALLVQRVCRVRVASAAMAVVIRKVLSSPQFVAHVGPDLSGVSVPHLSESQIGSVPVPVLDTLEYEDRARVLQRTELEVDAIAQKLTRQLDLLVEHRQALITAAVTGELDISGVAA